MMAMRFGFSMVLFGLAVTLLAACANPRTESDARLDKTVETLLDAIRTRDDSAILSLAANPPNFGERGRLEDDVAGFLYDGDFVRTYNPDARSVVEIMALGPLRVHIVREKGGRDRATFAPKRSGEKTQVLSFDTESRATVLFIPERFEEKAQVVSFYSERWMRDYFACEFHLIDGRWVLLYNICFALTDGPYSEPYGLRLAPIHSRLARAGRAPSAPVGKSPIEVYRKLLPFVPDEQ